MTFRQRIIIAFSIVLVLPVLLFMLSFIVIGNFVARDPRSDGQYFGYEMLTDDYQEYSGMLDLTCEQIAEELEEDPTRIEDPGYLQSLSERISVSNSYIVVRKGNDLYYTGNEEAAATDFPMLPPYNHAKQNVGAGYYIDNMSKMVKQVDFTFADGTEGSLFILTRSVAVVSRKFMGGMFAAMVGILLFTAILLTRWLESNFFQPINKLNTAMKMFIMPALFTALFLGGLGTGNLAIDTVILIVVVVIVVILSMTLIHAVTARLKVEQLFKFYWTFVSALAALSLIMAWMGL